MYRVQLLMIHGVGHQNVLYSLHFKKARPLPLLQLVLALRYKHRSRCTVENVQSAWGLACHPRWLQGLQKQFPILISLHPLIGTRPMKICRMVFLLTARGRRYVEHEEELAKHKDEARASQNRTTAKVAATAGGEDLPRPKSRSLVPVVPPRMHPPRMQPSLQLTRH